MDLLPGKCLTVTVPMLLQRTCLILLVPNSRDLCNIMIILLGSLCYHQYWEGVLDFVFKQLGMGSKTVDLLLTSWLQLSGVEGSLFPKIIWAFLARVQLWTAR